MAFKFLTKDEAIPSHEVILMCATRNFKNDGDLKMFEWYWEVVLPKMVGADNWATASRRYGIISSAYVPDASPKRRCITMSDEAMCVVMWENAFGRWNDLFEWENRPENKGKKHPNWNGKYTLANGGQSEWGAWTPAGLQAYNGYYKVVKAARKHPECKKWEKQCLSNIRKKYDITSADADTQEKLSRAKRRLAQKNKKNGGVAPSLEELIEAPMGQIVRTCGDDESDEETEDETE